MKKKYKKILLQDETIERLEQKKFNSSKKLEELIIKGLENKKTKEDLKKIKQKINKLEISFNNFVKQLELIIKRKEEN